MFSSYIRELTWCPGHSFVLRYILLGSLPVRGSFAVQFGDHFPSRDHLRAGIICGPVPQNISVVGGTVLNNRGRKIS